MGKAKTSIHAPVSSQSQYASIQVDYMPLQPEIKHLKIMEKYLREILTINHGSRKIGKLPNSSLQEYLPQLVDRNLCWVIGTVEDFNQQKKKGDNIIKLMGISLSG